MRHEVGERAPTRLFGTSGIRGRVDEFLTPDFAKKASLSFATYLGNDGTALVARDVRPQSELIRKSVLSGLSDGGINAVDCGVAPTPATLVALKKLRCKAAIVVTGSHVPAPTTGLLFFLDDTGEMDELGEERVEALLNSEQWRKVPSTEMGSIEKLNVLDIYEEEMRRRLEGIRGCRVVADPGNGAACLTLPHILENAGCEVVTINGNPDGAFPSRSPHPEPSNLGQLAQTVKVSGADLGVGTDSDGDRALFATKNGQVLWGDITSAIFARSELRAQGGGRIVTTISTSSLVQLVGQECGGELVVTRVGPPAIARALRTHSNVVFATEESGKHIWPNILLYGDATLATGKLLRIMQHEQKNLQELGDELPRFQQFKSTIPSPEQLKSQILRNIIEMWKPQQQEQTLTLDGLKVVYPDLSWFLIRPSGTEPVFRCQSESPDSDQAQKLLAKAEGMVHKGMERARAQPSA